MAINPEIARIPLAAEIVDHIEHLDDLPVLRGFDGASDAIGHLEDLIGLLDGKPMHMTRLSTKFDGSFSIIAGWDERDGLFFVGKKSIFNNVPVFYKTAEEIEFSKMAPDLKRKLKLCLEHLPRVITDGVHQGDFMFESADTYIYNNGLKGYLGFQPNTLIYCAAEESNRRRLNSNVIGIAFHTQYVGYPGRLELVVNKWEQPMTNRFVKCFAVFPFIQRMFTEGMHSKAKKLKNLLLINEFGQHLNHLRDHEDFPVLFKQWRNSRAKGNKQGFLNFYNEWFEAEKNKRKTPKGRETVQARWNEMAECYRVYGGKETIDFCDLIEDLKDTVINALHPSLKEWHVFYRKKDSKVLYDGEHEGFVVTNSGGLRPAKLVKRKLFSYLNFSPEVDHTWER